jgi:tetratricopeptide (TPR) repeat protein
VGAEEGPAEPVAVEDGDEGAEEGEEEANDADEEHAPAAGERAEVQPFELELPRLSRRARRMTVRQRRRQSTRLKASALRSYREEDYAAAERLYREAMEYNNWDVGAVEGLARSTARQSRFDEAVAWAQLAVSRASRSPIAYRVLGDVWRQAGHPDEARAAYERGIARSPNDRWLRQRLRDIEGE